MNIDEEVIYGAKDFPTQENFKAEKSSTSSSYRVLDDDKKFDFTISRLTEKPETMEYKICGINFCNYAFFNIVNFNWRQKI